MAEPSPSRPPDKVGRTLIKAFAIAGAILGAGALGLAKTVILLGEELGWIAHPPHLGAGYWWILGGAALGFVASAILVRSCRKRDGE